MILALHASSVTSHSGVLLSELLHILVRIFISLSRIAALCSSARCGPYCYRCLCVLPCVCVFVMTVNPAKTAELIDVLLGMLTWVGRRNHVFGGGYIPPGRGTFGETYLNMTGYARWSIYLVICQGAGSPQQCGLMLTLL